MATQDWLWNSSIFIWSMVANGMIYTWNLLQGSIALSCKNTKNKVDRVTNPLRTGAIGTNNSMRIFIAACLTMLMISFTVISITLIVSALSDARLENSSDEFLKGYNNYAKRLLAKYVNLSWMYCLHRQRVRRIRFSIVVTLDTQSTVPTMRLPPLAAYRLPILVTCVLVFAIVYLFRRNFCLRDVATHLQYGRNIANGLDYPDITRCSPQVELLYPHRHGSMGDLSNPVLPAVQDTSSIINASLAVVPTPIRYSYSEESAASVDNNTSKLLGDTVMCEARLQNTKPILNRRAGEGEDYGETLPTEPTYNIPLGNTANMCSNMMAWYSDCHYEGPWDVEEARIEHLLDHNHHDDIWRYPDTFKQYRITKAQGAIAEFDAVFSKV